MAGFKIITYNKQEIRFRYYSEIAPVTCKSFERILPFTRIFYHAKVSGQEIWINDVPRLDIIQENASVFAEPGEVVLGPIKPVRSKTSNCLGIYYGEGKGLDAANIFAKVIAEDSEKLIELGDYIWKNGHQELSFQRLDEIKIDE